MTPRPFHVSTVLAMMVLTVVLSYGRALAETTTASARQASPCSAPASLVNLSQPLTRVARRLKFSRSLKIVAIGSSSTAGAGASSPATSYPSRLLVELRALMPKYDITVLNRGVNGEEAHDMLARLDESVLVEKPDLVLWQVGTNSVLRDHPLQPAGLFIHEGMSRLKSAGADVVLIDPQFAPKVLAKVDVDEMVDLLETTAKSEDVNIFHRFAIMRHWRQVARIPYKVFLSPDELHMNDWSYGCIAKLLARSIAEATTRAILTADIVAPR